MGGGSAKLKWWLCGIKPAARAWEEDCCFHPEEAGMVRGKAAPTTFHTASSGTRCVAHGDDFEFVGPRKDMQRMTQLLGAWCQRRARAVLGSEADDDKEIWLLNSLVSWKSDSIEVEENSKHRLLIMKLFVALFNNLCIRASLTQRS